MIASGNPNLSEIRKRSSKEGKSPMDKKVNRRLTKWSTGDDNSRSAIQAKHVRKCSNGKSAFLVKSISFMGPEIAINVKKMTWQFIKWDGSNDSWEEHDPESNTGCPSKFLIMCLNTIQNALQQNETFSSDRDRPLFADAWGLEFWNCYANGNDVLDTNGTESTIEKIAWITSTAADTISMKEKEGRSFDGPFLLYLVQSQDRSYKVCQVCKFLEVVGIQTLSLHSGAPIDHQIQSLKSYEPEFLVSTPERLLELLSMKAVDISDVSLMVVDGLEAPFNGTAYSDAIKSIRQFISGNPQAVVFCDCK
ncbi:probable ATP-dependent RNA helicase ddx5 [Phtheirospermum japonicum]|uniref:Probable ATP-dependent RNA helicase ddx5 n=1 Tax=Phtheirospermum japonicum TaxID=374723 RepID=A0A830BU73_9LAMI|nr:probable ATP-dependent RNA helicase ddx5 [Phtheirospermum japonicum]